MVEDNVEKAIAARISLWQCFKCLIDKTSTSIEMKQLVGNVRLSRYSAAIVFNIFNL